MTKRKINRRSFLAAIASIPVGAATVGIGGMATPPASIIETALKSRKTEFYANVSKSNVLLNRLMEKRMNNAAKVMQFELHTTPLEDSFR